MNATLHPFAAWGAVAETARPKHECQPSGSARQLAAERAFARHDFGDQVEVVYGSSGKFQTQIRLGAPYDLYFSADIAYPRALAEAGLDAREFRVEPLPSEQLLIEPEGDAARGKPA